MQMFFPPRSHPGSKTVCGAVLKAAARSAPPVLSCSDAHLQSNLAGFLTQPGPRASRRNKPVCLPRWSEGAESGRRACVPLAPPLAGCNVGRIRWKIPPAGCGDAPRQPRLGLPFALRADPPGATTSPCGLSEAQGRPRGRGQSGRAAGSGSAFLGRRVRAGARRVRPGLPGGAGLAGEGPRSSSGNQTSAIRGCTATCNSLFTAAE